VAVSFRAEGGPRTPYALHFLNKRVQTVTPLMPSLSLKKWIVTSPAPTSDEERLGSAVSKRGLLSL